MNQPLKFNNMISPLAYVDPSAKIGKNVTIHPFAYIDKNVEIGDDNVIMPYVSILSGARIGNGNTFYQGAVISAVPQDFNFRGEETIARIGNNNTVREYAVIIRATHAGGETRKVHIFQEYDQIYKKCTILDEITGKFRNIHKSSAPFHVYRISCKSKGS